jgi:succinate dehydrogenase/fumarate reductase cytochrome b subunit
MVNEKRSLFSIHGMTGFLIATVVLVVVVLSLAYIAYLSQVENATNFYKVERLNEVQMIGSQRADHIKDVK